MTSVSLRLGNRIVSDGDVLDLNESARLDFVVTSGDVIPHLDIAGEGVPLTREGDDYRPRPDWLEVQRSTHLVGDCPVLLEVGHLHLNAVVRRMPTRITLDDYHFLLHTLRTRLGGDAVGDPLGRARIWAAFAPEIPTASEERARILVAMFERATLALRRVAMEPRRSLARVDEWYPLRHAARLRGRIDARRVRHSDPPRPAGRPTEGSVLVSTPDDGIATPENRYVIGVVSRLSTLLFESLAEELPPAVEHSVRGSLHELSNWFGGSAWAPVRPGPVPNHSFVIRDDADYAAISSLGVLLDRLSGLLARFPPVDLATLFPLNPYSLNSLYERWIQVLVFDWITSTLGPAPSPFASSGSWEWSSGATRVVLRLDVAYPRSASSGVYVPIGKNRPDVAVELWNGGFVDVLALDATYSQDPRIHDEKLQYASNLRLAGAQHPLTNDPPLVVRWAAFAHPAHVVAVVERSAGLGRADLSLPPRPDSAQLLARYLDATIGSSDSWPRVDT